MKKFLTLIIAISMVLTLAVTASANTNVIKKGTAVVDGQLDAAYHNSLVIRDLGTKPNVLVNVAEWPFTCTADVYFLYDDERLYVYCDVTDDDVNTLGKAFLEKYNAYQTDLIELRFSFNGDPHDVIKCSVDAYGYTLFGLYEHYDKIDYSEFEYKTAFTDKGYAIEISMPCTKGDMDMIKTGKLGFTYSLNDLDNDGNHYEYAEVYNSKSGQWTCDFYELSNEWASTNAPVTSAPVTTKAPETTPAPEETTEAPEEDTTAAEAEDTTAAEVEDTTAAEGEDTTVAEEGTTAAEGEDTTVAGESDTTVEGENTTEADTTVADEETTAGNTTNPTDDGEKKDFPVGVIIGIVAAVVVIAGIAVALAKKKKQ
ncbi:MAG: hypothetical protein IJY93_10420 [Clostridia bacterium]|nr:hypothetical protein [Clostridia bacterium]